MPVVGLVFTLSEDRARRAEALGWLATDTRLTLGRMVQRKLPAVLDTPDVAADRAAWEALRALPGVAHVDVVFAALSDATDQGTVSP